MVLNAGWFQTVARDRGLPLPDKDLLVEALGNISSEHGELLRATIGRISTGREQVGDMDLVATVGRSLRLATVRFVTDLTKGAEPGQMVEAACTHQNFPEVLDQAIAGNPVAQETLKSWLPSERDSTSAADGVPIAAPSEPVHAPAPNVDTQIPSHHVYGRGAALTFEVDRLRDGTLTVRIDGAKAVDGGGFDWDRKVIFQLTRKELHQMAAVALGFSPGCLFSSHGHEKNKSCEVEVQDHGLFVKLSQPGRMIAVPVGREDLYFVAALLFATLSKNTPHIDQGVLLQILRTTAKTAK